jgi:hypothetical protein
MRVAIMGKPRRLLSRSLAASLAVLLLGTQARAPAQGSDPIDVPKALAWLAAGQSLDGSWGRENKLAITGMSGLALLAAGSTPERGPYAENLRRAIGFVLSCQQADGKAFQHGSSGYSAIHNHGYALLFLTQCFGEAGARNAELRAAIEKGIRATAESQRENGGFSYFLYDRQPREHMDMWSWDEASTTISQIQALRGARDAGFEVARRTLDKASRYIARSQHKNTGGYCYSIGSNPVRVSFEEGSEKPSFAVTAAAVAVLQALGTYEGPALDRGVAYLETFVASDRKKVPFFYYGHYYAAQVMHMKGGPANATWAKALRAELSARQTDEGHWPADGGDSLSTVDSQTMNTAWALQVCLLDDGTLPLHER